MSRLNLATAALLSVVLVGPATAQQNEMKGQESGQRPAEAQPPANKMTPPEKMAPQGQTGGQMTPSGKQTQGDQPGEKSGAGNPDTSRGKAGANDRGEMQRGPNGAMERGEMQRGNANEMQRGEMQRGEMQRREKGGQANITGEQRTQIVTQLRSAGVRQARDVHIDNIRVGGAVPHAVTQYWVPVPATIVHTVPAWRSYRAVMVGDEILIIDPATLEIVEVLT